MIVALVVLIAMTWQDALNAMYVILLGRHRRLIAGLADGLGDVGALFSAGLGGAVVYHLGLGLVSALIIVATVAGSVAGAELGDRVTKHLGEGVKP